MKTDNARLEKLIDSLMLSDIFYNQTRPVADDCEILADWGWTHAISINGDRYGEIKNTGWFFIPDGEKTEKALGE
jgi:hypothetical protein